MKQLADRLIDNSFDSVRLRDHPSDLVTPDVPTRTGIGAHLTPTKKKRKSKSGTSGTFALQGKCCICSANTTHSCLDDRAESGSTWLCHSKNTRHCLACTIGSSQLVKYNCTALMPLFGFILASSGAILN
jgi:hypothetical protein